MVNNSDLHWFLFELFQKGFSDSSFSAPAGEAVAQWTEPMVQEEMDPGGNDSWTIKKG